MTFQATPSASPRSRQGNITVVRLIKSVHESSPLETCILHEIGVHGCTRAYGSAENYVLYIILPRAHSSPTCPPNRAHCACFGISLISCLRPNLSREFFLETDWAAIFQRKFSPRNMRNTHGVRAVRVTGWVSNSILSTVKTMLISGVIREKNQRLEAVRGVHCIDQ